MLIEEQSSGAQPIIPAVPTVGIGASAGGLKAMQAFFKSVASDLEIRSGVNSLSVSSSAKARPIPSDAPVTTTAGSYACQPSLIACPDFKGQDQTLRWSRTVITN